MSKKIIKKKEPKKRVTKFDYKISPEFVITDHAMERIKKRFGCNKSKIKKIVVKAWTSTLPVKERFKRKSIRELVDGRNMSYKSFCSFIFVFKVEFKKRLGYDQKTLITVYNYKTESQNL